MKELAYGPHLACIQSAGLVGREPGTRWEVSDSLRRYLAVVGSRTIKAPVVVRHLAEVWTEDTHIITGGARGVDRAAAEFAAHHGDSPDEIAPDWDRYPADQYGKDYAPKERNKEIVDRCDRLLAFWDGRSGGTAHTIAWAVYRGKPVSVRLIP